MAFAVDINQFEDFNAGKTKFPIFGDFVLTRQLLKDNAQTYSLASKRIDHKGVSFLVMKITIPEMRAIKQSMFKFDYFVSSELSYDKFSVWIDGIKVIIDSGSKGWSTFRSRTLDPGDHLIVMEYRKDISESVGLDRVFINSFELIVQGN